VPQTCRKSIGADSLEPVGELDVERGEQVARLAAEFGGSPSSLTHLGLSQLRGKSLQQELAEKYWKSG
jgi:hypothetical protein